jgi:hypothetical protein
MQITWENFTLRMRLKHVVTAPYRESPVVWEPAR